jgi:hypothetical protein
VIVAMTPSIRRWNTALFPSCGNSAAKCALAPLIALCVSRLPRLILFPVLGLETKGSGVFERGAADLMRGHSCLAPFPSICPFFPIPPISIFFPILRATGDWHFSWALDRAGQQAADRRGTQGRSQQCQSGLALWR